MLMRGPTGDWAVPSTTSYGQEADLRDLLAANPSIIPGVNDPTAAAVTELGVPAVGRVDVVVVESTGAITVVEAKLATNADIRRTVIGQVFAYAAGLAQLDLEGFERAWQARSNGASLADQVLGADSSEADVAEFHSAIVDNLAEGRFRLLLAVDSLTDELRLIIGYLASHLDLEVIALELAYASHDGVDVLVPRTWGSELTRLRPGGSTGGRPSGRRDQIADVIDDLVLAGENAETGFGAVVQRILTELAPMTAYLYSGSSSVTDPVVVVNREPHRQPAKIITSQRIPGLRVCFQWCRSLPVEQLDRALDVLLSHPLVEPHVAGVRDAEYRKRPLMPFKGVLDNQDALTTVLEALAILFADPAPSTT